MRCVLHRTSVMPYHHRPGWILLTMSFSNPEIYLTEAEFAGRYHLGRRTVQRWRQTGQGPPWVRLGARRVLYRLSDCEGWAAARTYRHRADELARLNASATA